MQITIGELTNELVKYSNVVETNITGGLPFTRAFLATEDGTTRVFMYIVQVKEGIYSACTDISDLGGSRFFPTGNSSKPFIREMDKIHMMFGGSEDIDDHFTTTILSTDYYGIINYLYHRLMDRNIIRATEATLETKITSLGINNMKIIRAIEKGFVEKNARTCTVGDLVTIVSKKRLKFNLEGLRSKSIQCVAGKFKELGITLNIKGSEIIGLTFDRR